MFPVYHLCQTPCSSDVSRMNQAVQVPRRLLNLLPHFIVTVQVEHISDQVECVLIVLNISIESRQVESVRQIILVNFTEVLIAS